MIFNQFQVCFTGIRIVGTAIRYERKNAVLNLNSYMRKVTIKLVIIILSKFILLNSKNKVLKFELLYKKAMNMFQFEANIWGFVFTITREEPSLLLWFFWLLHR